MVDFRAELAALVAAYDGHRKWMMADKFATLQQAVEHARAVLAQPGPAPAVEAAIAAGQPVILPSGTVIADPAWFESLITIRAAAQAPQPVAVSERPWEREGWCDAEGRCWMGRPLPDAPDCWDWSSAVTGDNATHCLPHDTQLLPTMIRSLPLPEFE